MVIKDIIQIGNPLLNKKSEIVKDIKSKKTQEVIKNLVDSMQHYHLAGMAAPQIGENIRIFATEIRKTKFRKLEEKTPLQIYINPKLISFSKKQTVMYEGCGSVAYGKLFAPVKRPKEVSLEAFDQKGKKFKLKADGFLSRVIQHEYDHLEGIEFTRKISDITKIMSSGEYIKKRTSKKENT
jgi:peptide deformylase